MALSHILVGASEHAADPAVRSIAPADLVDALKKGWDDFSAMPSHAVFLCVIYPAIGILVAGPDARVMPFVPLLFPAAAGFALIGPFAALGLYELSRRREAGLEVSAVGCVRGGALALDRRHRRAGPAADGDLPGLDGDRARHLHDLFRLRLAGVDRASSSTTCSSPARAGA